MQPAEDEQQAGAQREGERTREAPRIEGVEILEGIGASQNEVFKAKSQGELTVLRLTDGNHRSGEDLRAELKLLMDLQPAAPFVAKPLAFPSGEFIEAISYRDRPHHAMLFAFVDGPTARTSTYEDACGLGALLARLHKALAALSDTYDLPVLKEVPQHDRLIHGDFNATNILAAPHSPIIVDFENACYASYEYEMANSIYMEIFDHRHDTAELMNARFIEGFLEGYLRQAQLDRSAVRDLVRLRVSILKAWLNDPSSAPRVITTSSKIWKGELRNFVCAYEDGEFEALLSCVASS